MSQPPADEVPENADLETTVSELRETIQRLEQSLHDVQSNSKARVAQAELKAAAAQAGMIDLDGLKLIDLSRVKANDVGEIESADELMSALKREKPWLFAGQSSASRAAVPPARPARPKLATEMNAEEYRAARADLVRRR
jgi:hypothetical protein